MLSGIGAVRGARFRTASRAKSPMTERQQQLEFLIQVGTLLLEYNESSGGIIHALTSTARTFGDEPCHVSVTYLSVTVSFADEPPVLRSVQELRLNAAVRTQIHETLQHVRLRQIDVGNALERLSRVISETPRHPRWLVAVLLGAAACSFARLLAADTGAIVIAGVSTTIGLLVRQELNRREVTLLALPLVAAFIGAVLGGIAIRLGWTQSPDLVLIVPALMLVPGPHLLNGLFDLVDNHLVTSMARLTLAMGILLASALGIVLGARVALPTGDLPSQLASGPELNLLSDMILAGIATCGFAAYFNVPWRQMGLAAIGGMVGHGIRFLALESAFPLETATLFGGLVVGAIAACIASSIRAPVAVLAFAGAVTMVPGSSFYRALGGALRLARENNGNQESLAATTLTHASQGLVVVGALALGLLLGIRVVLWIAESRQVHAAQVG
jgi:uncharacterized membrane protein YjjP (DUF1212 family)